MKAYTSIKQSKKLAEILPIESADMWYGNEDHYKISVGKWNDNEHDEDDVPCWSLAALLDALPKHIKQEDGRTYKFHIFNDGGSVIQRWGCSYITKDYHNRAEYLSDPALKYPSNIYIGKHDNLLDACVDMIEQLHEQKLL